MLSNMTQVTKNLINEQIMKGLKIVLKSKTSTLIDTVSLIYVTRMDSGESTKFYVVF